RYFAHRYGDAGDARDGGRLLPQHRRGSDRADRQRRTSLPPCLPIPLCHRARDMAKLEPRGRKVKILATLGPASSDPDMLRRLFRAGADAFRINLSHGDHETHAKTIKNRKSTRLNFS